MSTFKESLDFGLAGETEIAFWLKCRGGTVFPAYEKILETYKGPAIFTPSRTLVAPDYLVWNGRHVSWVEAKHKSGFTWYWKEQRWTTGIDLRHYRDYLEIEKESPWPVWLLFLSDGKQTTNSPGPSPKGLYGNRLSVLQEKESHRSDRWGKSGMVYWAEESLRRFSEEPLKAA